MAEYLCQLVKINCGTDTSKMAWIPLKVIHVLESLQQTEYIQVLDMFGLQATNLSDW